jgi:hypothetical protein
MLESDPPTSVRGAVIGGTLPAGMTDQDREGEAASDFPTHLFPENHVLIIYVMLYIAGKLSVCLNVDFMYCSCLIRFYYVTM